MIKFMLFRRVLKIGSLFGNTHKLGYAGAPTKFIWTAWFKGQFFLWRDLKLNSGNPYYTYRLGPLMVHQYLKEIK